MIHCETYGRLSIWDALLRQEHRIGIGEDWIEGLMRGAGIRAKTVKKGWLYLTVALALYSRFAISWAMGFRLTMDSPEQVLTMALPTRPQGPGSCTIRIAAAIRRYALPVSAARPLAMTPRPSSKQGQQSVTRCPRNRGEAISLSEPRFRALTT